MRLDLDKNFKFMTDDNKNRTAEKSVNNTATLGAYLRSLREDAGLEISQLAEICHIPEEYIKALEEDRYDFFSARVYAQGSIKKILNALNVEKKEFCLTWFSNEWQKVHLQEQGRYSYFPEKSPNNSKKLFLNIYFILEVLILAVIVGFFIFRIAKSFEGPTLEILYPQNEVIELHKPILKITGTVDPEASLTVNGREAAIDDKGKFTIKVYLQPGLNTLEFIAKDRFGRLKKKKKYIVAN